MRSVAVFVFILLFAAVLAYSIASSTQAVLSVYSFSAKNYDVLVKNVNGYIIVFDSYGNTVLNTTNATEAFLAAFNHAYSLVSADIGSVRKATILVDGKFWVNKTIMLNLSNFYLVLRGMDNSGFYTNNNITIMRVTNSVYGFSIENIVFDGVANGTYLLMINGSWGRIAHCYFGDSRGIYLQGSNHVITSNRFEDTPAALVVEGSPKSYSMYIVFSDNIVTNVPGGAVSVVLKFTPDKTKGVQYAVISNNVFSTYYTTKPEAYVYVYGDVKAVTINGNIFHNALNGVWINNYYTVIPNNITVAGNSYLYISEHKIKSGGGVNTQIWDSNNFEDVRIKSGVVEFVADGNTTVFAWRHGYPVEPSQVFVQPLDGTAWPDTVSINATHVIVTYNTAPANGTTLRFSWLVRR